jgi:type I restriction enzyme S subunit
MTQNVPFGRFAEDWRPVRLKHTVGPVLNGLWGEDPGGDTDDALCVRVADFEYRRGGLAADVSTLRAISESQRRPRELRRGDLLLEKSGGGDQQPVGRVVLVDRDFDRPAVCSNFVARMRPNEGFDARYLSYLHRGLYSLGATRRAIKQTTGIQNLDGDAYLGQWARIPDLGAQAGIATFLDRQLDELDTVAGARMRVLRLLAERETAAFTELCLGLHTHDLAPTHLENIPVAPAHWQATRLRRLDCDVQTGPFGSQLHAEDYVPEGYPVINPANLRGGVITPTAGLNVDDETRARLSRHVMQRGDVVFGRRGELGRAALVDETPAGWLCGTGCLRIRFRRSTFSPRYLAYFLRLPIVRQHFEAHSVGSTMDNLNTDIVLAMPVLVPPLDEQERIASACDEVAASSARASIGLQAQAALLHERREVLVVAAVTGRLDTRRYVLERSLEAA